VVSTSRSATATWSAPAHRRSRSSRAEPVTVSWYAAAPCDCQLVCRRTLRGCGGISLDDPMISAV
ncbi:MAG: hypothetical protein ACYDC9_09880, partial [Dermatophilaceae bacterium]